MNLEKAILDLVEARKRNAEVEAEYQLAHKIWEEANAALVQARAESEARLKEATSAANSAALMTYKETGLKKFIGGVGIRIYSGLKIVEGGHAEALEFAKKNLPATVRETFDEKILIGYFEGVLKADPNVYLPTFIQKWERPTPTLPKEIIVIGEACIATPAEEANGESS